MGPSTGLGTTELYRHALDRLRRDVVPVLDALERAAADPASLDDHGDDLPALQYALHTASERALGLDLGPDAELETALTIAREETADVAEALEASGALAVWPLVWEWRVSLFGVRLALLELEREARTAAPTPRPGGRGLPLVLLVTGVAILLGGALASLWPVWTVGLALVTASTALAQRLP